MIFSSFTGGTRAFFLWSKIFLITWKRSDLLSPYLVQPSRKNEMFSYSLFILRAWKKGLKQFNTALKCLITCYRPFETAQETVKIHKSMNYSINEEELTCILTVLVLWIFLTVPGASVLINAHKIVPSLSHSWKPSMPRLSGPELIPRSENQAMISDLKMIFEKP